MIEESKKTGSVKEGGGGEKGGQTENSGVSIGIVCDDSATHTHCDGYILFERA